MKRRLILLVEDNINEEYLAVRALKKSNLGSEIIVVRDGVEALDFLFCMNHYADRSRLEMPELILLDLKLQKMDGLEVLRRLRADERTRQLPIVVLSSSDEVGDIAESYKYGANSFVRKPVDFDQFMENVKQIGQYWLTLNEAPPK